MSIFGGFKSHKSAFKYIDKKMPMVGTDRLIDLPLLSYVVAPKGIINSLAKYKLQTYLLQEIGNDR